MKILELEYDKELIVKESKMTLILSLIPILAYLIFDLVFVLTDPYFNISASYDLDYLLTIGSLLVPILIMLLLPIVIQGFLVNKRVLGIIVLVIRYILVIYYAYMYTMIFNYQIFTLSITGTGTWESLRIISNTATGVIAMITTVVCYVVLIHKVGTKRLLKPLWDTLKASMKVS